jgi:glyoxylase-like metal-dependent hydrolase (beta-lactamase superfamily II)
MKLTRTKKILAAAALTLTVGAVATAAIGFRPSTHPTEPADLGTPSATSEIEAVLDQPTDVRVETIVGADWEVDRSGLINLDSPEAKEAGLVDGPEPIQVYFHAVHHPTRGLYLIDTGVERALFDDPEHAAIRGLVATAMHAEKMKRGADTATWIASQKEPVKGVFLTHLHLDHVSGMPDVPKDAEIFAGPGETSERGFLNVFVQSSIDRALEGHRALREWKYERDPSGTFLGVLDVFGDKTVFALHVPGHTAGSTAYLVRSTTGPILFTGDACHTAWGWEHGVEPGTFSADRPTSKASLGALRAFVAKHPEIDVRLGHQSLPKPAVATK